MLKGYLITLGGLAVCGALALGSLAALIEAWYSGVPLKRADL